MLNLLTAAMDNQIRCIQVRCNNPSCTRSKKYRLFKTEKGYHKHLRESVLCLAYHQKNKNKAAATDQPEKDQESSLEASPSVDLPDGDAEGSAVEGNTENEEEALSQHLWSSDDLHLFQYAEMNCEGNEMESDEEEHPLAGALGDDGDSYQSDDSMGTETFQRMLDAENEVLPGFQKPFVPPKDFNEGYLWRRVCEQAEGVHWLGNEQMELMPPEMKSSIALLEILKGYPANLFDKIRKWQHKALFTYQE